MTDTIVLIEHDGARVPGPSLHAITAARQFSDDYTLLILGHGIEKIAAPLCKFGAARVLVADGPELEHALADRYAALIAKVVGDTAATTIIATSSTFTRDLLPRIAALLDAPMLSDVLAIDQQDGQRVFRRPIYAGSAVATVSIHAERCAMTVRAAAFEVPQPVEGSTSAIEAITYDAATLPAGMQLISAEQRETNRPELTEAKVVVSGGRPLKDRQTFDRLIGALADALGAAVGTTRAAVDAGIAPNDWQIGQTGKVIAPDLYIAAGVSGAIQHLAGIKDARVIVAINRDPDAVIFKSATYGLVGDLFEIVPQLIEAIKRQQDQTSGG